MLDLKDMELEHVKGNTWVLKSWLMIPCYKIDDRRCILLDSGIREQRDQLEETLQKAGLTCVGVIGTHAHMDHTGSHAYFQRKNGATVAMSLGEAGIQASRYGLEIQSNNLSPKQIEEDRRLGNTECVADVVIMPKDRTVTVCGVTFDVIHTPGHSVDHICIRTPDNVLYLGDTIMTGKTLYKAKFPYILAVEGYFESLTRLRTEPADFYIAAHWGVYPEIISYIDMELRFLSQRMKDILGMIEGKMTVSQLTQKICHQYGVNAQKIGDLTYFERATRAYIYYLLDRGDVEAVIDDNTLVFQRTEQSLQDVKEDSAVGIPIPRPGALSAQLLGL